MRLVEWFEEASAVDLIVLMLVGLLLSVAAYRLWGIGLALVLPTSLTVAPLSVLLTRRR